MSALQLPQATRRPSPIVTPADESSRRLTLFYSLLLVVCILEFCQAWVYGLPLPGWTTRLPLRLGVWLMVPVATLIYIALYGAGNLLRNLAPLLPFWVVGLLAGFVGFSFQASTWLAITWMAAAISGTVLGLSLGGERVIRIVSVCFFLMMAGSAVVSIGLPSSGQSFMNGQMVWRGLFNHKNALGQMAALSFLFALFVLSRTRSPLALVNLVLSSICLLAADSKGGLVTAVVTAGAVLIAIAAARRLSGPLRLLGAGVVLMLVALALTVALPLVLQLLGRDITLTGRTTIWAMYFDAAMVEPWLGRGPGAFTNQEGPTQFTFPLALRLVHFGPIYTAHNAYIGVFGDVGLIGLFAFVLGLLWLAVVPLLRPQSLPAVLSSACAVSVIVNGAVETGHPFGQSAVLFFILLFRAAAFRDEQAAAAVATAPDGPAGVPDDLALQPGRT